MVAELAGERLEALSEREKQAEQRRQFVYDVLDERTTLDLVFQPLWDLRTMEVVGLEALSRFPDLGLPPDVVFNDAASVGLAVELDLHVVEVVLREFHRLPGEVRLNINVSPDTLTSDRFKRLVSGYPRDRLVIEVTEHAVVRDYAAMRDVSMPAAPGARGAVELRFERRPDPRYSGLLGAIWPLEALPEQTPPSSERLTARVV